MLIILPNVLSLVEAVDTDLPTQHVGSRPRIRNGSGKSTGSRSVLTSLGEFLLLRCHAVTWHDFSVGFGLDYYRRKGSHENDVVAVKCSTEERKL